MATNTEYLDLKKPAQGDFYNVDDFSENFQKIDDFAKRKDNPHNVTAEQIGLGNVDNTSDMDKPISWSQAQVFGTISGMAETAQSNITDHKSDKNNPHNVTSAQIGLDKVPNVATNDQTPTYTEASAVAELTSGEKLSVAFGKIKKAISSLISHLADTTKHITSTERNTWNGKAPNAHSSTATTYGVGTSTNYGHLKITDDKTSTASGTAASAKALSEAFTLANKGGFKLLKSQTISTITLSGNATKTVNLSGIDINLYSAIRIVFNGVIKAQSIGTNSGESVLTIGAFSSQNHMDSGYQFVTYSASDYSLALPTFDDITVSDCEVLVYNLRQPFYKVRKDKDETTYEGQVAGGYWRTPYNVAVEPNMDIYFKNTGKSVNTMKFEVTGTFDVYGKEL